MLLDDQGREVFAEASKDNVDVEYFRGLFSSSQPVDMENLFEDFSPRVSDELNVELTKPVSMSEIKAAVFEIKGRSGPGADGFTGNFYQQHWGTVGKDLCTEISLFFQTAFFPSEWNFTNLYLIPKVTNPTRMRELRPISLCSVHYKITSKILCSRLKKILPDIISDTQGAFVSGRLISDNVLIAHEMIHALRTYDTAS
ncbi:hypothetical protein V5N11_022216 [Cardamine amara subsp. amara]|uniref:Reverse transcriptase domain-containing protein n=1 Tax=Cardamine amara subsp. amara TaxID=228776 RepID=A0ABD1BVK1_CARAN